MSNTLFFRLLACKDKSTALLQQIRTVRSGVMPEHTYAKQLSELCEIPNSPLAYWVEQSAIRLFRDRACLQRAGYSCNQGLITADDFRFLRLCWETYSPRAHSPADTADRTIRWAAFAKGSGFSRYYTDIYMLADCHDEFAALVENANRKYPYLNGGARKMLHAVPDLFFTRGLTYSRRTTKRLSVRILPECCVFADKSPGITLNTASLNDIYSILAVANSACFEGLLSLSLGAATEAARSYETGIVERVPLPLTLAENTDALAALAREAHDAVRSIQCYKETSPLFCIPSALSFVSSGTLRDASRASERAISSVLERVDSLHSEIDRLCWDMYGLPDGARKSLMVAVSEFQSDAGVSEDEDDATEEGTPSVTLAAQAADLLSYIMGCAFGRWDIRYPIGQKQSPELPNAFAALPTCPPGMLQNADGRPAEPNDLTSDYPIRIPWPGVIVDDKGHLDDVEIRVREAMDAIWGRQKDAIEQEVCDILKCKSLRDYIQKPSGFFADHLKRYSKSRRQAPIYWPLSTASGSYTLWIYCHRLTNQTLYSCINDFVEIKQKQVSEDLVKLRNKSGRNASEEKDLERLSSLDSELKDLRNELLRVAAFWRPDLNDGVQITAAPLWQLFRFPKWRNALKETWEKLEKGEYDWAHLALEIWPDRVRGKCRHDKSLAVAHGLEELYEEPPTEQKKGGRRKKAASEGEE